MELDRHFFFYIGSGKIGSGILTIKFLSQLSPVLRWVTIGVNFCYTEVINHTQLHTLEVIDCSLVGLITSLF